MEKKTRKKNGNGKQEETETVGTLIECNDKKCPVHGSLKTRGRIFEGRVARKFKDRVVIEFERMVYVRKYERYYKAKTRIHAHLPQCMENQIQLGDLIRIQETRPLSKIIHFTVINKIKSAGQR